MMMSLRLTTAWLLLHVLATDVCYATDETTGNNSNEEKPALRHTARKQEEYHHRQNQETRIVGGLEAPLNAYPFHIQWALGCGGTLIWKDLMLTAAHCFFQDNVLAQYPLFIGGDGTKDSGTEVFGEALYPHPMYAPDQVQAYDFMVIKLRDPVDNITPVRLNTQRTYPVDKQTLTVMGFGLLDEDDEIADAPTRLRQVDVNFIQDCAPEYYTNEKINDDIVFCAAAPNMRWSKDACQGDSGGPIIDANGLQVGLVSWGIGRFP